MAFLKVTCLIACFCFATAVPQLKKSDQGSWQLTNYFAAETNILGPSYEQIGYINSTMWLYNYTASSSQLVVDTVRQYLAGIPIDPEDSGDSLRVYETKDTQLPLQISLEVVETISTGPKPVKTIGFVYSLDGYAKKKHRAEVLAALKNLSLQ